MFFNQRLSIPVNKKNEGILFVGEGIPASRPLHIYRKTGAHCPSALGSCTITDKPLKMLGKNKQGVFIPPDRCRTILSKPYYPNYSNYMHRRCASMTPMYTISNLNNPRFNTQGAVSESTLVGLKKYEEIIKHNQSLLKEYNIHVKYSSDPVRTLKDDIAFGPQHDDAACHHKNNTPSW